MQLLSSWLSGLSPTHRVLDLGCGTGSLRSHLAGLNVIGSDVDLRPLISNPDRLRVCAESHELPFSSESFDLVICHHSLEHFGNLTGSIREIRRVLKPMGRMFVSVPDGLSFSDRLYRCLFCGGGHVQCFSFDTVVSAIESGAVLHLEGWMELFSSFIYLNKQNFVAAPRGRSPGPLPRRMRWLGQLPRVCFDMARIGLNIGTRLIDLCLRTRLARYGWALAFGPAPSRPEFSPGSWNVCMSCGAGVDRVGKRVAWFFYRCPSCFSLNIVFQGVNRGNVASR